MATWNRDKPNPREADRGHWSADSIRERYRRHQLRRKSRGAAVDVQELGAEASDSDRPEMQTSRLLDKVIGGVRAGDPSCVAIAIELVEEDGGFFFGAMLKADAARALRQVPNLTDQQVERLRARIVGMYARGEVPREFREYAKLLRKLGVGPHWATIVNTEPKNHYAERARSYFLEYCNPDSRCPECGWNREERPQRRNDVAEGSAPAASGDDESGDSDEMTGRV